MRHQQQQLAERPVSQASVQGQQPAYGTGYQQQQKTRQPGQQSIQQPTQQRAYQPVQQGIQQPAQQRAYQPVQQGIQQPAFRGGQQATRTAQEPTPRPAYGAGPQAQQRVQQPAQQLAQPAQPLPRQHIQQPGQQLLTSVGQQPVYDISKQSVQPSGYGVARQPGVQSGFRTAPVRPVQSGGGLFQPLATPFGQSVQAGMLGLPTVQRNIQQPVPQPLQGFGQEWFQQPILGSSPQVAAMTAQPASRFGQQSSPPMGEQSAQGMAGTSTGRFASGMQSKLGQQQGGFLSATGQQRGPVQQAPGEIGSAFVDVYDAPEALTVFADIPGVDAEDVRLEGNERTLRILSERQLKEEEELTPIQKERARRIERIIDLPTDVDIEDAEATCEDGVCKVKLPKAEHTIGVH